jgi:hypothetical protein
MNELYKVLDSNEKVLWQGTPSFLPYIFSRSLNVVIFGIFWLIIVCFLGTGSDNVLETIIYLPHFWIGVALVLGPTLYGIVSYGYLQYAVTDKRVILQDGLIGRDFTIIDFDKIDNVRVDVNIFDKLFGGNTGTIFISPAQHILNSGQYQTNELANIHYPYETFKFLKKVSYDIKTDIEYPNKLRPTENPGYQTQYTPHDEETHQ